MLCARTSRCLTPTTDPGHTARPAWLSSSPLRPAVHAGAGSSSVRAPLEPATKTLGSVGAPADTSDMTAGNVKRRHHTTPRVYLRGFAERDRVSIRTRSGVEREVHIADATVRKNFYNFRTSKGVESSAVEKWLDRSVENPAGPVFERLRRGLPVTERDRPVLAKFAVSQLLRTPTTAAMLDHIDGHIGPMLVVQAVLPRHDIDPTTMPQRELEAITEIALRAWEEQTGRDQRRSQLRTIMRKVDELTDQLAAWTWVVLEAADHVLITSDAPVATFHNPDGSWAGIIPPGSPVYLPLSPRHLRVGERHALAASPGLQPGLADMVNKVVARQAADMIIKAPLQSWPTDLVLLPQPSPLPTPTITWRRGSGDDPTFPAKFPDVLAPNIRAVLDQLEATDVVQ